MFRSLLYDHPQGLSFVLGAFTTFPPFASSFAFLVCGRMLSMCMCVSGVAVYGLAGRVDDQTTHRQVHRTHIHIDGIRPHTKKANDEANSGKVVNAPSTKDNP
jgi:hypothetical protein